MSGQQITTAADLDAAIRTLLPGLRFRNYVERWADGSPAVQALRILADTVQDAPVVAGEDMDPNVPSYHRRPPEAEAPQPVAMPSEEQVEALLFSLYDHGTSPNAKAEARALLALFGGAS